MHGADVLDRDGAPEVLKYIRAPDPDCAMSSQMADMPTPN